MVNSNFKNYYKEITNSIELVILKPEKFKCKFCGCQEDKTTFKKDAHILSNFLGKNNLISYEECDRCNEIFSKYESHFSKYFTPYLTLLGIKGKRRVPVFQSRSDGNQGVHTKIIYTDNQNRQINVVEKVNDIKINDEEKNATLNNRISSIKPLYIYKIIVKYGLSIIPHDKIDEFENVFYWLINKPSEIIISPLLFYKVLSNKKYNQPSIYLYERIQNTKLEDSYTPKYTLVICFANIIGQIFLPTVGKVEFDDVSPFVSEGKKVILNSSGLIHDRNTFKIIDLSSSVPTEMNYDIKFKFGEHIKE